MGGRGRSGVTLIEITIVIVIMAVLLGLAIGLFKNANRDLGVRAATHHVVALLRSAAEHAKVEGSATEVVLDTQEFSVHTLTKEPLAVFHLENDQGAFGRRASIANATPVTQGYYGGAYRFTSTSTIDCGDLPIHFQDPGLAIEFYLKRSASRGRQVVVSMGPQVEIAIEINGRLTARIGNRTVNSGDRVLAADLWYEVQLLYNTMEAKLYLNGLEVGTQPGKADWTVKSPLVLGAKTMGFVGILDEVRVSLIVPRDRYFLPSETKYEFPQGTTLRDRRYFVVWFDGQGRLDETKHPAGVTFKLKSPADEKTVAISGTGVVVR